MRPPGRFASGIAVLLLALAEVPAAPGTFSLVEGDAVVFTGGENMVAAQENGYLELLLTLAFSEAGAQFRNMAWEGDTVFEQPRQLNFAPWRKQFERVGATVIFAQFGQMEALAGAAGLAPFAHACDKLLDEFTNQTQRIVLLSPTPFEAKGPPMPDLSKRNDELRQYVDAIREIAARRGLAFVDLFSPLLSRSGGEVEFTRDGIHWTEAGHWEAARVAAGQLGVKFGQVASRRGRSELAPAPAEQLRASIIAKNRLWFHYWRPMNWAFLHGDRTEQPSSRDHRDAKIRWFPAELEQFGPLIAAEEKRINELAQKAAGAIGGSRK